MFSATNQQTLQAHLAAGAHIITANRRLQRSLLAEVTPAACQAAPAIAAADDWVREHWFDLQDLAYPGSEAVLISAFQSRKLWQEIVESDSETAVLSPLQLAQQACEAAQLIDEWKLDTADPAFEQREEYQHFCRWKRRYQQLLADRSLTDNSAVKGLLQQAFDNGTLVRKPKIILYGFDSIAPTLEELLRSAALELDHWQPQLPDGNCCRTAAPDSEAELRAAALWARTKVETNASGRIGIIVPQLHARRAQVERIFSEVFEPGSWMPESPRLAPPFNFSAGVPLSSAPLVADALLLLGLNQRYQTPEDWRQMVLSPFWGDGVDYTRHQLLIRLNRSSKIRLAVAELRRMAEQAQADKDWPLAETLNQFTELVRRQPKKQSFVGWAKFFDEQLRLLKWPGSRVVDSPEYQQQQHFYSLLDALAQSDAALATPVTLVQALSCLRDLADATTFQIQTQQSPVQILGMLEGAGLHFDHCWVTDLSDVSWPPSAKPNPFIPLSLQVPLRLPRSSVERELDYARALTARYRQSAKEVVFSWPAFEGEVSLQPSQLITDCNLVPIEQLAASPLPLDSYITEIAASSQWEVIDTSRGPAWLNSNQPLPGGTGVLRAQALCPFNAFATYRLGAFPTERPTLGLTPAERGTLLHELLAAVWRSLESHARLVDMENQALEALVAEKVEETLAHWRLRRSDLFHPQFYKLEHERLSHLVLSWLELERLRPPFEIAGTELKQELTLTLSNGTNVTLIGRLDRVDRLTSGKRLIVDYKTGKAAQSQWHGERPLDLQLPLYALAQAEQVAAISFAQVNAKRVNFAGVGCLTPDDGTIDGVVAPNAFYKSELPGDWEETLSYWRERASALVEEFVEGDCRTQFFNKSQAQYYRHLEPLNRAADNWAETP